MIESIIIQVLDGEIHVRIGETEICSFEYEFNSNDTIIIKGEHTID